MTSAHESQAQFGPNRVARATEDCRRNIVLKVWRTSRCIRRRVAAGDLMRGSKACPHDLGLPRIAVDFVLTEAEAPYLTQVAPDARASMSGRNGLQAGCFCALRATEWDHVLHRAPPMNPILSQRSSTTSSSRWAAVLLRHQRLRVGALPNAAWPQFAQPLVVNVLHETLVSPSNLERSPAPYLHPPRFQTRMI